MNLWRGYKSAQNPTNCGRGRGSDVVVGCIVGARRTFNRGIVFVDEMALNQLNRQARFTNTTAADDDELVLSQELLMTKRSADDTGQTDRMVARHSLLRRRPP